MHKIFKRSLLALSLVTAPFSFAQEGIISAGSAVTEIISELGAGEQLIAIDVTSEQPKGKELPVVGYHRQLSAEGLLALSPDMVVGSDEMGPDSTLKLLNSSGVKIEKVNSDASVEGLYTRIDQIGALTGHQEQAAALKSRVSNQVAALESRQPQSEPLKVMFLLIHQGRPANVAGSDTTPDAMISLAGGTNPAAGKISSYKPLSNESLIEMQPDVILVSGRSWKTLGGAEELLKALPVLAATPAGKNQRFITVDGKALVGGVGLKTLAEAERINSLLYTQ